MAWELAIEPISTPSRAAVGPPEGVLAFGGQGVGPERSACRIEAAYAVPWIPKNPCLPKKRGRILSEKVGRRIMRQENLLVHVSNRKEYSSYKDQISPEVPNVLQRDFHASTPNQKWLTNFTEFSIPPGKIYLSPIIDCFDGLVESWSIGTSPNAQLVNSMLATIKIAVSKARTLSCIAALV